MMIIMLPVVFMAVPGRRPPPTAAEIAAEAAAKAAEEQGRLDAHRQIAMRRTLEEHAAKETRMARIEPRLPKLKGAAEEIVRQMHRELLGPEIGQTAHKKHTSIFSPNSFKQKFPAIKEFTYIKATSISPDAAKKRAALAKADAEGLVRAHNKLVAEWNRVSDALGRDRALHKQPINLDALVDLIVEEDKLRYKQKDRRDEAFEAMKRRLKSLRPDPEMKKAWDEKVEAMKKRHTQEFDL